MTRQRLKKLDLHDTWARWVRGQERRFMQRTKGRTPLLRKLRCNLKLLCIRAMEMTY